MCYTVEVVARSSYSKVQNRDLDDFYVETAVAHFFVNFIVISISMLQVQGHQKSPKMTQRQRVLKVSSKASEGPKKVSEGFQNGSSNAPKRVLPFLKGFMQGPKRVLGGFLKEHKRVQKGTGGS